MRGAAANVKRLRCFCWRWFFAVASCLARVVFVAFLPPPTVRGFCVLCGLFAAAAPCFLCRFLVYSVWRCSRVFFCCCCSRFPRWCCWFARRWLPWCRVGLGFGASLRVHPRVSVAPPFVPWRCPCVGCLGCAAFWRFVRGAPPSWALVCARARFASRPVVGCPLVLWGLRVSAAPFSLSGVVAFGGSRFGSPVDPAPFVGAVAAAGGVVRVGCARGVDSAVAAAAPAPVVVAASAPQFQHLPPAAALAARTRAVVLGSSGLVIFAPASGVLGRGSSLAVATAREVGVPVWVCSPLPPCGSGWVRSCWLGVSGWCLVSPQGALF